MEYNERNYSILTQKNNTEILFTLKNFPVSMSCVDEKFNDEKYLDMIFCICKDTGLIYLKKYPLLKDIYITPHNSTSYGNIWKNLFENISDKVHNIFNELEFSLLEIGGGSLLLASKILDNCKNIQNYDIYEKNSSLKHINNPKITLYEEYFTNNTKIDKKYDIIIHSHVLEHVWDCSEFMNCISNINHNYHLFAIPNLEEQFSKKFPNSFNFEHNVLITEPYVDVMLHNNNYEIILKEKYLDHSIIYITKKIERDNQELIFPNKYKMYKKLAIDYFSYYNDLIIYLNNQIDLYKGKIYLFGAHIFSQILIHFGLNTSKIINILDNSKEKTNLKLYGTKLTIKLPIIIENNECAVILKVSSYQEEIKNQLLQINSNVKIIE